MAVFEASEAYIYHIVQEIHSDSKLAKLDFINCQCVSNDELTHLDDISLFITVNDKSNEIDLCDVTLVHTNHEGGSTKDHKILWTAQITTHLDFLRSLQNNYSFGKILFLLELNNNEVEIFIVIKSSCFEIFQHADYDTHFKTGSMKPIFQSLFTLNDHCIQYNTGQVTTKKNILDLYEYIKNYHQSVGDTSLNLQHKYQHKHLLPSLRNYQAQAVHWMISRETECHYETDSPTSVHPVWQEIECCTGEMIYFNTYTGGLTKVKPLPQVLPKGGILADEMGLGKTVEVLACVLNHQPPRKRYLQQADKEFDVVPTKQACIDQLCHKQRQNQTDECKEHMGIVRSDIIDFMLNKVRIQCLNILQKNIDDKLLLKVCYDLSQDRGMKNSKLLDDDHNISLIVERNDSSQPTNKLLTNLTTSENKLPMDLDTLENKLLTGQDKQSKTVIETSLVLTNGDKCRTDPSEKELFDNGTHNMNHDISSEQNGIDKHAYKIQNKEAINDTPQCKCSTLNLLREYYRYKIADNIPHLDEPIKCNCGHADERSNNSYSRENVETYMPECEIVFNKRNTSFHDKYIFKKAPNDDMHVNITHNDYGFYIMDRNDTWNKEVTVNGIVVTVDESLEVEVEDWQYGGRAVDEVVSKYQSKRYPKKDASCSSLESLTNVRNDHGLYYKIPSYELELYYYYQICFVCGDLKKNMNATQKVKCRGCGNVMHKECTGYKHLNVKNYECANCAMKQTIETPCTLIICPDTLCKQWVDEVEKHVKPGTLKYMVYRGVKFHQFLHPKVLAECDLIITTFSTLRLDFYNAMADKNDRSLRRKKKYSTLPCPLLALKFWRVCIDEAQIVESYGTGNGLPIALQMALQINAVHRWCVTGTPLERSIEDIYGLFLFLSVDPYQNKLWWKRALIDHYHAGNHTPLFNILSKVMWRMSKKDVEDELGIPKQTEYVSWLQFSAIEHYFYEKQFEICRKNTMDYIRSRLAHIDLSIKVTEIDKQTLTMLLSPLLQLRQACCHPAAVQGSYISMEKKSTTMEQLLGRLIRGTKTECEESQRKLVSSLNGLAGVEILNSNYKNAADIYHEAMLSWEENSHVKTDSLQKLHTLHNLASVMKEINVEELPYINLEKAAKDCDKIHHDYLNKLKVGIVPCEETMKEIKVEMDSALSKVDMKRPWWLQILLFKNQVYQEELMRKIEYEISRVTGSSKHAIKGKFHTLMQLRYVLFQKLEAIEKQHEDVIQAISTISHYPDESAVLGSAECCLRPVPDSDAPKCNYCTVNEILKDYEKALFSGNHSEEGKGTGFRSGTEIDKVLQVLYSSLKIYDFSSEVIEQAREHLKYWDLMKKEFETFGPLLSVYYRRVQGLDELSMCVMRIRYQIPGEPDIPDQHYVIQIGQLDVVKLALQSDKIIAKVELKKKQSQLLYLQNLTKIQTEYDGFNPDTCPICASQLGTEWAVFKCGHCFCCGCITELQSYSVRRVGIKCPYCRELSSAKDIHFVVTKQKMCEGFNANIPIKGHFSTKIEAILRRITWIQCKEPGSKILVFSSWTKVLQLIKSALQENDILFTLLDGNATIFQKALTTYKQSTHINVLLSPLSLGGKGLNIIEATHVIFTEPALKSSEELQAVGRIHRIGQIKETFVHRFVVKGTVEEKMYYLHKTKSQLPDDKDGSVGLTVNDLAALFT